MLSNITGNVFTGVCHFVPSEGGTSIWVASGCTRRCNSDKCTPGCNLDGCPTLDSTQAATQIDAPLLGCNPDGYTPPHVNRWAVSILLECIIAFKNIHICHQYFSTIYSCFSNICIMLSRIYTFRHTYLQF